MDLERILISPESLDEPLTASVLSWAGVTRSELEANKELSSANSGVRICLDDSTKDPLRDLSKSEPEEAFNQGKKSLKITRHKGDWLRACPGTSNHVCCNLWTVNPGEGCPLDCTYCYLQSWLKRNPTLKLFSNEADMLAEIKARVSEQPSRYFRIGTGEVIDSLVFDEITDSSTRLVPFFAELPNAALELKTKSANVGNLLDMADVHGGQTVVSWSMNAECVTEEDEKHTASLDERIEAARAVQAAGYRVGIHLDPLIHFSGWEVAYREAVKKIFSTLDESMLAWVSVSTLRYKPEMQSVMENRFPESKIPYGEQFLATDGKYRYFQALRFKMLRAVWSYIKETAPKAPAYMCMESSAAWKEIAGGAPAQGEELREVFTRSGGRNLGREIDKSSGYPALGGRAQILV